MGKPSLKERIIEKLGAEVVSISMPHKYREWVKKNHINLSWLVQEEIKKRMEKEEPHA